MHLYMKWRLTEILNFYKSVIVEYRASTSYYYTLVNFGDSDL